ncbi:Variant surface glycoprotein, partial [Trypanosoma congolense IL3000]
MEWEMWLRVLLVLIVFEMGGRNVEGNGASKDIFETLCKIAGNVSVLMKNKGGNTDLFREALYGENGRGQFEEDGTFKGNCGSLGGPHHRSTYCSHMGKDRQQAKDHGCFGDSLLGTFLCLCVPGQQNGQDLCGLGIEGDGIWSGEWNSGVTPGLLKNVWEKIKGRCTAPNTTADTLGNLEDLKNSVNELKNNAKNNNLSGNGQPGYYLGSSTTANAHCRGSNQPQDGCVTYPDKSGKPDIPWTEKILGGITKLNVAKTEQKTSSTNLPLREHHQEDPEDPSDHDQVNEEEETEEEGELESAPNPGPQNHSKTPRQKRKRR